MTWLTIRNFGKVKYFNLSYLVIIGVPFLAEVYRIISTSATNKNIDLALTFPLKFKLLYLASLCYALAIAIYQYFCPHIVKTYENEQEYVDASQEIYERAYPNRKLEIVLTNLTKTQTHIKDEIKQLKEAANLQDTEEREQTLNRLNRLIETEYPSCVQRFLINSYRIAQNKYRLAIYASGLLYLVGTLIVLILVYLRTVNVFSA